MNKPDISKIPSFYRRYVEVVPEGKELMSLLMESRDAFLVLLESVTEEKGTFAYEDGKWTIKELIGHISDSERVFTYRALRFGRGDLTDLAGFEQDDYVVNGRFNEIPLPELIREFTNIRNASIDLFNGFDDKAMNSFGSANGFRLDVNSLGYIIVGHLMHHMSILEERYLS